MKTDNIFYVYLTKYLHWAETRSVDGSDDKVFSTNVGLCANLWAVQHQLNHYLNRDFGYDPNGKPLRYPFGEADYIERREGYTMHLCPNRIGWVKKIIAELKETHGFS